MADQPESASATCIHCLEPIRPGARRCPHCRSWQSRWAADAQNPRLELLLLVLAVVAASALLVLWARLAGDRAEAPDPAASIEVVELRAVAQGSSMTWVGLLRNHAEVIWRNVYFHVECVDAGGELVDVVDLRSPYLVLGPGQDTRFKLVHRNPLPDREAYQHCRVEVRLADRVRR